MTLGRLGTLSDEEGQTVEQVVAALTEADALLAPAGLGIGYRLRDEAALFVLHAAETPDAFRTRDGTPRSPARPRPVHEAAAAHRGREPERPPRPRRAPRLGRGRHPSRF